MALRILEALTGNRCPTSQPSSQLRCSGVVTDAGSERLLQIPQSGNLKRRRSITCRACAHGWDGAPLLPLQLGVLFALPVMVRSCIAR